MAQCKKCFSCNHKAWSFDTQINAGWLCLPVCNSRALMMETEALYSKRVGRTSYTGEPWSQARGPALTNIVESGNISCLHAQTTHANNAG